jgi:hypothetical protein
MLVEEDVDMDIGHAVILSLLGVYLITGIVLFVRSERGESGKKPKTYTRR